jgi:hypothetical protein
MESNRIITMFNFNATFHPLVTGDMFACWKCADRWGALPPHKHTQHMTMTHSEIFYSNGIDVSKNQFYNEIDFLQGIDSVESMPGFQMGKFLRNQTFP